MKERHCNQCGKDKPETLEYFYRRGNNGKFCATCIKCKLKYDADKKKLIRGRLFSGHNRNTLREKVGLLERSFDLSPYLRAYGANEKHPAWFLSSYTDNAKLRRAYEVTELKF